MKRLALGGVISLSAIGAGLAYWAASGPEFTGPHRLDLNGANGHETAIRFTKSALKSAFRPLRVVKAEVENPFGGGPEMFLLKQGESTIFVADIAQRETEYTFSVFTLSSDVIGPNEWRVGTTVLADVVGKPEWECTRGFNEQEFRVFCMNWTENFRLLFQDQSDIGLDVVAAGGYDPVLNGAGLEEMRLYLDRPVQ